MVKGLDRINTLKKIVVAVVCALAAAWLYRLKLQLLTAAGELYGVKGKGELTEAEAQFLAERLFDAMSNYGTDEKTINEVFAELCKHNRAILQVHEAFGLQRYCLGASDIIGIKKNLNQWLKSELSAKEYAKWQTLYESALK